MNNYSIRTKLTLMFLLVGLVPFLVTSVYLLVRFDDATTEEKLVELQGHNGCKKGQLERWFQERQGDLGILSTSEEHINAITQFRERALAGLAHEEDGGLLDGYRQRVTVYCQIYGYEEFILMNPAGDILFSLHEGKSDAQPQQLNILGMGVLGEAFSKALTGSIANTDLAEFELGGTKEMKMYFLSPLRQGEQVLGVVALGMHVDHLTDIMATHTALGETGESYILGADYRTRTPLRFAAEIPNFEARIEHNARIALGSGDLVLETLDYREREVLSAYHHVDIPGLDWTLVTKIDRDEALAQSAELRNMVAEFLIFMLPLIVGFAVMFSRSISCPIKSLTAAAQRMARGEIGDNINFDCKFILDRRRRDELGQLAAAFEVLYASQSAMADSVAAVSEGILDATVPVRGERDRLAASVNHMLEALRQTARQARHIAAGDYNSPVVVRSQKDELGLALEQMTVALRADREENARQHWLQSGLVKLNEVLAGEDDATRLAAQSVNMMATWTGAQVGALYVLDGQSDAPVYELLGSYAFTNRKNLSSRVRPGEGLVGQAARERKQILVHNVPEDYVRVSSGLGESSPRNIVVTPLLYEETVLGVLELGSVAPLGEKELVYLERAAAMVALGLEVARSRTELRAHQEELQASNRELQSQAAELERSEQELLAQQRSLEDANEELKSQMQVVKISEDRLRAQQQELEAINVELTAKNEQLRRQSVDIENARRKLSIQAEGLEKTSKYKSEFMANMSHELRTPLNSLLILARSLRDNGDGNLNEEQVESAGIIYDSGRDLLDLINDILDLSKIESGQMRLRNSEVNLNELCHSMRAQFVHVAREKGIELEIARSSDAPEIITTDQQRLGQILKNLVGNALKFTMEGRVTLSIERPPQAVQFKSPDLLPASTVAIRVADTGIGIAEEMLERIFGAFQQVESGDARSFGGTGLGLSISDELAGLLGGEIQVESRLGEGSTFWLYLPVTGPEHGEQTDSTVLNTNNGASQTNPIPESPVAEAGAFPDDRRELTQADHTILIVEDDRRFAKVLQAQARKRGFKTLVALTGEEGLQLARRFMPAGVVLDLQLPGMDGWSVLGALKGDTSTRHIPVHIVSASEFSNEGMLQGAIGHATKPISLDALTEVLDRIEHIITEKERRVLLVEDDDVVRQETVRLIENGQVRITSARTGAEALEALRTQRFHLVILDLGLPDMQGTELLRLLSEEGTSVPPVIINTVRDLTVDEEKILRDYASSIIVKDVRSQERLVDEVALFLHHVVTELPQDKKAMIHRLHGSDEAIQGKTVLIVEDDMRTLFAMSKLLGEHGVNTLKAENGRKAIELLNETDGVDMILMDMMMPVLDGYETMRLIRADGRYATLPIIALTAKAMAEDRGKCLAAGATDYMSKPIEPTRLLSLMRVWMEGR